MGSYAFSETPMFVMNSMLDMWQMENVYHSRNTFTACSFSQFHHHHAGARRLQRLDARFSDRHSAASEARPPGRGRVFEHLLRALFRKVEACRNPAAHDRSHGSLRGPWEMVDGQRGAVVS